MNIIQVVRENHRREELCKLRTIWAEITYKKGKLRDIANNKRSLPVPTHKYSQSG